MFRWLILISCVLTLLPVHAAADEPTFVIDSDRYSIGQANDYRIGNFDRELSESEMLQILQDKRYERTTLFEVHYHQYLYFSYLLENRSGRTQTVHVRFPLWFLKSQLWILLGEKLVPLKRYPRWGDTFYIDVPPGAHRMIGMRLSASTQQGQAKGVRILDFQTLEEEWRNYELILAIVYGAVVTMIFYNLGMYLVYRKKYFIFYMLYSGAALYAMAMINGYAPYDMPRLSLAGYFGSVALILFCNSSLNIARKFPRVNRTSIVCGLICLGLSLYSIKTGHWLGFALSMPVVMSYCCLASIASMRDGYKPALYFVIGWGVFMVCCTLAVLNIAFWGYMAFNYVIIVGFAAEVSLFSFAIGQKVRLSEEEALRANHHAFNQLKKVFYPHQIQKMKDGSPLEETMPTSERDACALCFDIVRSSLIESRSGRNFIEDSLKACESALTEHYDGENMVATGYRVKEMGDGFLCTVGYPFRTVKGQDPAVGAVELAQNFVRIFQRRVDELAQGEPIFCSVGLAFGNIQGHFPKVGVVEYEVDGRALDLAQRYESFRKLHFPDGPPAHVITIHAALYQLLPSHLRKDFVAVDLRAASLVMRDDPAATHVYYCLLTPDAVRRPLQVSA